MELKLNKKEVEDILLNWAQTQFPNRFNVVEMQTYSASFAEFSYEPPAAAEGQEQ